LLLYFIVVGLALDAFDAVGKDLFDFLLQGLLLLVVEEEVQLLDLDEDVALVEVVDQAEVAACQGYLQGNSHVFGLVGPFDAALEARNGAFLLK
jgi:hypothetical protein